MILLAFFTLDFLSNSFQLSFTVLFSIAQNNIFFPLLNTRPTNTPHLPLAFVCLYFSYWMGVLGIIHDSYISCAPTNFCCPNNFLFFWLRVNGINFPISFNTCYPYLRLYLIPHICRWHLWRWLGLFFCFRSPLLTKAFLFGIEFKNIFPFSEADAFSFRFLFEAIGFSFFL